MPAVAVIGPAHEAVLAKVRAIVAGATFEIAPSTPPARGAVAVFEGAATNGTPAPYVIVGGSSVETPYHTMGRPDGARWGGSVEVPVRLVTRYPTTEAQTFRIWQQIRAGLDEQPLTVEGFNDVSVTVGQARLLTDLVAQVVTRELVALVDVHAHQQ